MIINIDSLIVLKTFGFIVMQPILVLFLLFPVNEQPISNIQKAIYVAVNILIFILLFGFVKINSN